MKKVLSVIVTALAGIALTGLAFAAEPPSTTVHSPDVQRDTTLTGGNDAGANPVGQENTKKHHKKSKHSKKTHKSDQDVTGAHGTGTGHGLGTGGTGGEMSGQDQEGVQTPVQPYSERSQPSQPYSNQPQAPVQPSPDRSGY